MPAKRTTRAAGLVTMLECAPYKALCAEFAAFRIDAIIQLLEKNKDKGRILGFVRGLRLSAQLIYQIRDILSGSGLRADWGHLVDEDTSLCSPECDIIIYDGTYKRRWNNNDEPVMDFRFVEYSHAKAVISCKSYLTRIDTDYPRTLRRYVKQVWLFAECCPRGKENILRLKARKAGYKGFYYLYPWDGKGSFEPNEDGWISFSQALQSLRPKK